MYIVGSLNIKGKINKIAIINVNIMTLFVFLCLSEIKKILFSGPNGENYLIMNTK
jgi:hypothetical protein